MRNTHPDASKIDELVDQVNAKVWTLYLLECADSSYYIGITNRLSERIAVHNAGKGAKYTRGRLPVRLMGSIECESQSEALKAELKAKKLPKRQKKAFFLNSNRGT